VLYCGGNLSEKTAVAYPFRCLDQDGRHLDGDGERGELSERTNLEKFKKEGGKPRSSATRREASSSYPTKKKGSSMTKTREPSTSTQ